MSAVAENLFPLFAQPAPEEDLTPTEARDVLLILGQVAERLSLSANSAAGIRRRLDAIAGAIVAFMDQLADLDGMSEQGFDGLPQWLHRYQPANLAECLRQEGRL